MSISELTVCKTFSYREGSPAVRRTLAIPASGSHGMEREEAQT